jgi:ATP-dependent Clp protease ATP-binding subunit ClpA
MIAQETPTRVTLQPEKRSAEVREFEARLRTKFIGQDEAVSQFVDVYQTVLAGMSLPGRPIANLLFSGADRVGQDPSR